jgi:hypothetical protein
VLAIGPMVTTRCIYCLETKPDSEFNAEHVIPRAFGKFQRNLTLHCVCESCNTHFGRNLDEKLSRDSIEAVDRVRYGVKKSSEFRSLGKRSTLHARITDGPLAGAYAHHVPAPDGKSLGLQPLPQVAFAHSKEGPFEWFLLDEIPSREEYIAMGYGPTSVIRAEGVSSLDVAQEALERAGFSRGTKEDEWRYKDGTARAETIGFVGDVDCRAVAKIAFNYFASIVGPAIAMMPQFNDVRRYVREGVQPPQSVVLVQPNPGVIERATDGAAAMGHFIAFQRLGSQFIGQVSLFLRMRYAVLLSADEFSIPFTASSAHFFDLESREIAPIEPPPLVV